MSKFDALCNKILSEKFDTKLDIPYKSGQNAPTRYNNPGGAYPKQSFEKYGLEGYGVIAGNHKIGKYPTPAHGVAANIAHLREMLPKIEGKSLGQARHYWHYGDTNGTEDLPGMDMDEIVTREKLYDQNWLIRWMKATAQQEGFQGELDDSVFTQAFKILDENPTFSPSGETTGTTTDASKDGDKKDKDKEKYDNPLFAGIDQKIQDILQAGGSTPGALAQALRTVIDTGFGAIAASR